jgi:hypothetical protein
MLPNANGVPANVRVFSLPSGGTADFGSHVQNQRLAGLENRPYPYCVRFREVISIRVLPFLGFELGVIGAWSAGSPEESARY